MNLQFAPNVNQKRKSLTFNNGQRSHFSWNRQANGINIRITPTIPTPNLEIIKYFQPPIIPTLHLLHFRELSNPPPQLLGTLE